MTKFSSAGYRTVIPKRRDHQNDSESNGRIRHDNENLSVTVIDRYNKEHDGQRMIVLVVMCVKHE